MDRKYLLRSSIRTAKFTRIIAKGIDLFLVLLLSIFYYPLGLILALIYIALSDSFYEGQSVGKRLMGFAVVSLEDGAPCSVKQSFIRNLPFIVPLAFAAIPLWGWLVSAILAFPLILLELYLLIKLDSGHRLGDVMADTTVIGNDPNRVDIRKQKTSWFDQKDPVTTPVNHCPQG